MTQITRTALAGGIALVVLIVAIVGVSGVVRLGASPTPSCDLDTLLQGCGMHPPTFAGADCPSVGTEIGAQLNARLIEILDGPATAFGVDRSALATSAQVYVADRANFYLREHQLVKACSADALLAAAVPEFSARVQSGAAILLADPSASFEDWTVSFRRELQVVDDDEDVPYGSG